MQRWNRIPSSIRLAVMPDPAEPEPLSKCLVCGRTLPKGLKRIYCLRHSAYPQQLANRRRLHQEV